MWCRPCSLRSRSPLRRYAGRCGAHVDDGAARSKELRQRLRQLRTPLGALASDGELHAPLSEALERDLERTDALVERTWRAVDERLDRAERRGPLAPRWLLASTVALVVAAGATMPFVM